MASEEAFQPEIVNNEWKPRSNEVAVRLYDRMLSGNSFIVPPTQTGTLIVDGKVQGRTVGKQDLKSFWSRFIPTLTKKTTTQLYLARNGLIDLAAIVSDAKSKDGHSFYVLVNYQLEIDDLDRFCHHFFQASDVATTNAIEMILRPTIATTIEQFIRSATSSELIPSRNEVLNRLADDIYAQLRTRAKDYGLAVAHVMMPTYSSTSFEELIEKKKKREEELQDLKEAHEYYRQKHTIEKEAYELDRDIRELDFDRSVDDADFEARLISRKNEIKAKEFTQRLQIQQGIDRVFNEFQESRRVAKEKQEDAETQRKHRLEDAALLRNHVLEQLALGRSLELEGIRHEYHLTMLQNQGVITLEQLRQRQAAYDQQAKLLRQMLEDSLANRELQESADRSSTLSQHELDIRIRRDRDILENEMRRRGAKTDHEIRVDRETFTQGLLDWEAKRDIDRLRQLSEIQQERLDKMHGYHMDKQRHDTDTQVKLRELDIKEKEVTRTKSDLEVLVGASVDQIRALAEFKLAEQGHSAKHAADKEAMYQSMLQMAQLAQAQTPAQISAMLKQQEDLWKSMFDRLDKTGNLGLQALKEVAMEMAKSQKVTVQMPDRPMPPDNASKDEMLSFFKAWMMAQARNPKN